MKPINKTAYHELILGDLITPIEAFLRLRDRYFNTILLESSEYNSNQNNYSYICCDPYAYVSVKDNKTVLSMDGEISYPEEKEFTNILSLLKSSYTYSELNLPFTYNGLFGYSGFESYQNIHSDFSFRHKTDNKDIPSLHYALYRFIIVFDHYTNDVHFIEFANENESSDLKSFINHATKAPMQSFGFSSHAIECAEPSESDFLKNVEQGIAHCKRGDVFQLVLSREFQTSYEGDVFNVYRSLRNINPSPYLFFFDYAEFQLFGSSPEAHIIIRNNEAQIHPIAGTYRRTGDDGKDAALAEKLSKDDKELAEHVMLVDLARNDLNISSEHVKVDKYAEIQYFSHVIHLVSKVTGQLEPSTSADTVYTNTFPAGTLSGAPKRKAIELIDKYEDTKRSFYGGSIGIIGFDNSINQAILIRSALAKNNRIYYQAGAGIVVNSSPENELQEVTNKTDAIRKAIQKAKTL